MSTVDRMKTLRTQSRFLAGLDVVDVASLSKHMKLTEFESGQKVCEEGEPGEALYIIDRGKVKVSKHTAGDFQGDLAVLGPGSVVGEMSLLDGQPCSATAIAVDEAAVHALSANAFMMMRLHFEPAAYKIIRNMALSLCRRLRVLNQHIRELQANPERLRDAARRYKRRERERSALSGGLMKVPTAQVQLGIGGSGAVIERKAAPKRRPTSSTAPQPVIVTGYEPVEGPARVGRVAEFLRQIATLRSLTQDDIVMLAETLREHHFEDGAVICEEGDEADGLYIIAKGGVDVCKRLIADQAQVLATLRPGAMVGEVSLIDGGQRSATCVAKGDTVLLSLERIEFDALFKSNSSLAFRFVEIIAIDLSLRLRSADDQFAAIFGDAFNEEEPEQKTIIHLDRVRQTLDAGQQQRPRLLAILGKIFSR